MSKWRTAATGFAAIAGAIAVALPLAATTLQQQKATRYVDVPARALIVPDDPASLAHGRYLFGSRGCAHCHGADGAGRAFIDEPGGLFAKSPNLTAGAGSVVRNYRPADWDRAVRHGVRPDRTPLFIMPSDDYNRWSDEDVAALIAYVRSLPPEAGSPAEFRLPTLVRLLYAMGVVKDAAEKIDHSLAPGHPVEETISVENGAYVASMCIGCHGARFSGGRIAGGPPAWPAAANLTPGIGSAMPRYRDADDFVAMLHSGKRPDGGAISAVMPFDTLGQLSDVDARAVYLFLKQLPPLPFGQR